MMRVLVYAQKLKEVDFHIIKHFFDLLVEYDFKIGVNTVLGDLLKDQNIGVNEEGFDKVANTKELIAFAPDILITLGGDGTILSAISLIRDTGIPIMGINLGRLGFLASVEKTKIELAIKAVAKHKFILEKRTLLKIDCDTPIFGDMPFALNDFTIHKRDTSSMITIHTYVDGQYLNSYWADGIIVATPTGSTGYSMSCGGPIVFPGSGNLVITPVAPHSLNVRPLVISDTREISFQVEGRGENFLCTLDSRYETITHDDRIKLSRCDFHINLVMLESMDFMNTIRTKLMWGLDKRN